MIHEKKTLPLNAICFTGVFILFLILKSVEIFLPTWNIPITIIKGITSAIPFGLAFYATIKRPDFFDIGFSIVLFIYLIGDILIRINFVAGVIAFLLANLLMSGIFVKIGKFSKSQLMLYLISLVVCLVILIVFKDGLENSFYPILVYTFVVLFMMISSLGMSKMIRIGAILFFISDLLLGIGVAGFGNVILSIISLGTYYIAICTLANVVYRRSIENNMEKGNIHL